MDPWYKIVTLRQEVREGRSFSPDEFAIALEQVVAQTAPEDYRDPAQFFSRTCFTRALEEHSGMVLRRLSGKTENTAPVLTLITQFGGGKTHTLTSLYHLANAGAEASELPGVADLLKEAGIAQAPSARVGVFVGNAWDPAEGRETPWIDLARQLAGEEGVAALGAAARTTPPGTESLARVFAAADAPVLLLFDEVLNFVNRHRGMAESFHAFIQNLTVAVTGTRHAAAVISLPRSQVEMTDWDQQWQDRIKKVVGRVARDLIANDESEISEVVRRRLFENLGAVRVRKKVAKAYTDWCFERMARLPPEWLAVDTATTETKAREFLRGRFEACYPFHPATLSVFQRKWRALRPVPADSRRTGHACAVDLLGRSRALPKGTHGVAYHARIGAIRRAGVPRRGLGPIGRGSARCGHRRRPGWSDGACESPGCGRPGCSARHPPPRGHDYPIRVLRRTSRQGGSFARTALRAGEPEVDTTTIDNAAAALETSGFFIRKVGTDGYCIHHQATLKKVVSDRRASLDEETEIKPAVRKLVESEFKRGATLPVVVFPEDSAAVQDSPRLALIVVDPETEWKDGDQVVERIGEWTEGTGKSPRLYPARWSGAPGNQDGNFARRLSCGLLGSVWRARWRRVS